MRRYTIRRAAGSALTDAVPSVDASNNETANCVTQRWLFAKTAWRKFVAFAVLSGLQRDPNSNCGIPAMRLAICG